MSIFITADKKKNFVKWNDQTKSNYIGHFFILLNFQLSGFGFFFI